MAASDVYLGYERRVGRWSRVACGRFLDWLGLAHGRRWLDVGCGPGATTVEILARARPGWLLALEPSAALEVARARIADSRVRFLRGAAEELALRADCVDVTVSGLVLNHLRDPPAALREMVRVTRSGGTVAGYVWDYAGGMQMMRSFWDAAIALDPGALEQSQGTKFAACAPGPLRRLFEDGGLDDVEVQALDVPTRFTSFDDYWEPMTCGDGSIVDYVGALPATGRDALRERLRAALPRDRDGGIPLVARAFAVAGRVRGTSALRVGAFLD